MLRKLRLKAKKWFSYKKIYSLFRIIFRLYISDYLYASNNERVLSSNDACLKLNSKCTSENNMQQNLTLIYHVAMWISMSLH